IEPTHLHLPHHFQHPCCARPDRRAVFIPKTLQSLIELCVRLIFQGCVIIEEEREESHSGSDERTTQRSQRSHNSQYTGRIICSALHKPFPERFIRRRLSNFFRLLPIVCSLSL